MTALPITASREVTLAEALDFHPGWTLADRLIVTAILTSFGDRLDGMKRPPSGGYIRVHDAANKSLAYINPGYITDPENEAWWPLSTMRGRKK
jgi:hypothetical protein